MLCSSLHQMTPLHVAAERGHFKIVQFLVGEGADVNTKDNSGVNLCENYQKSTLLLVSLISEVLNSSNTHK